MRLPWLTALNGFFSFARDIQQHDVGNQLRTEDQQPLRKSASLTSLVEEPPFKWANVCTTLRHGPLWKPPIYMYSAVGY